MLGSSQMNWSRTHPAQRDCQERVHMNSFLGERA